MNTADTLNSTDFVTLKGKAAPQGENHLSGVSLDTDITRLPEKESVPYFYRTAKRMFDITLAFFGIAFSSPLWAIFAALIKLESPGPIFYHKVCYTSGGRKFKQWKFRSMVDNAEKHTGMVLATVNDERITKIGWFLRKTAMDELPQLINILLGEMSFVGPRPQRVKLVDEKYVPDMPNYHDRHLVRPGLTGIAQVYGRYDTDPRNKLRYDLVYVKKYNMLLDLQLLFMSFWITMRAKWQVRGKNR
ncbi:MAG: sugar transferase [Firmicutes bacterium]|nr:sugar transferase [Bacillota bacterium]